MYNDKFSTPYVEFVLRNYEIDEHLFIYWGGVSTNEIPILEHKNVVVFSKFTDYPKLLAAMFKCRKIYLHSLFFPQLLVMLFLMPFFLRKCNWVVWGGDLYFYKYKKNCVADNVCEWIRKRVIKRFAQISTSILGDFKIIQKVYKTRAKRIYARYPPAIDFSFLDDVSKKQVTDSDTVSILLGNSADLTNDHKEALANLSNFSQESIQIICPLSYGGNAAYISEVIKFGHDLFGEKFVPLTDFMSKKEYGEVLAKIDICIMNHKRQQGLNNIRALLYLKRKVYLNKAATPYEYFTENGVSVYDVDLISSISFDEFNAFASSSAEKNRSFIAHTLSEEYTRKIWQDSFESDMCHKYKMQI